MIVRVQWVRCAIICFGVKASLGEASRLGSVDLQISLETCIVAVMTFIPCSTRGSPSAQGRLSYLPESLQNQLRSGHLLFYRGGHIGEISRRSTPPRLCSADAGTSISSKPPCEALSPKNHPRDDETQVPSRRRSSRPRTPAPVSSSSPRPTISCSCTAYPPHRPSLRPTSSPAAIARLRTADYHRLRTRVSMKTARHIDVPRSGNVSRKAGSCWRGG